LKDVYVHPSAIVDEGADIGPGTRVWHFCHVYEGASIGRNCVLGQNVMVAAGSSVGDGVKIQNNVSVYSGVVIEDDVFVGPSVVFTNVLHPRAFIEQKESFASTVIGKGATLGANCTIVPGVEIGPYAFIGAGAVVLADIPDHALVVGNPAKQVGWVGRAGLRLDDDLVCPKTGEAYERHASGIRLRAS
jgi:UDP-2-acetamido-3-amino-2,3-dideoxy-glucuronate N-acetyltransferase